MNYFAHGHRFVDDPYFLAGTAVPDWLSVVDRKVRVRSRHARPFTDCGDRRTAALACGIVQHHRDDRWFHGTSAFLELSRDLSRRVRQRLPVENGFRCAFLGHLLVEVLLDWQLIADQPERLEAYYMALDSLAPDIVAAAVDRMAPRPVQGLAELISRFSTERVLADYGSDQRLLRRLNQVMRRVHLPQLPGDFVFLLPEARQQIRQRKNELLDGLARIPASPVGWDKRNRGMEV